MSYSLEFIAHVILEKQSGNVPKGTKKKLQESCLSHVFCLRKSARSAGDLLFPLCKLLEYSCVDILPQITQITQTNTAELYYFAEYFVWIIGVIGDICVNLLETLRFIW